MSEGALAPDQVVGDRYRLRRPLGEGGMGWVWEANDIVTHARCALKFLKGAADEDRRRFRREVRAAAAVRHPNVISVHELLELPDGALVIVMDLLEGETLGARLLRDGRLTLADVAATLLPVVSALEAAHAAGIVHRDLKPDNIFLSKDEGTNGAVKVLDFGLAKLTALEGVAARTQALTGSGSMLGTPYYMSPEQVVSERDIDARADIWSLGVVMYECLAGVRPTEADNVGRVLKRILLADFEPIRSRCEDLPEDVASLVTHMLVVDRDGRTRELEEVRAVLVRYARDAPTERIETRGTTKSSRPWMLVGIVGAGLATIGVASAALSRSKPLARADVLPRSTPVGATDAPSIDTTSAPVASQPEPPRSVAPALGPSPSEAALASSSPVPPAPSGRRAEEGSRPPCAQGLVLTNEHCCARGFLWRSGRCEQDIAVKPPF